MFLRVLIGQRLFVCLWLNMGLSPYVDVTLYPFFRLQSAPHIDNFILGFIVSDDRSQPSWGGYYSINSDHYDKEIKSVRDRGGDVVVSFGGASGKELATVCSNPKDLFEKYKDVIEKYSLKKIDFDIEGLAMDNQRANKIRSEAIKMLVKRFPKLHISLTLPVNDFGLTREGVRLVESHHCDMVNIMAMNFGKKEDMVKMVIRSAKGVRSQVQKDIGITVMIGQNDIEGEVFSLKDAGMLKKFVDGNSWVKRLSFWSLNRDNGKMTSLAKSSLIDQKEFDFSKIFIG